jgi:thiamine biosynthesis protein ThiS
MHSWAPLAPQRCDSDAAATGAGYLPPVPTIVLNGEDHQAQDGATVATLLGDLDLDPREVAVERNREIVPRATYGATPLREGDQVEVVTFVGGG